MATGSLNPFDDANHTGAHEQIVNGRKAFDEALVTAERTLKQATKTAERLLAEGAEIVRSQTKVYADTAGEQFDDAQKYTLKRIKSRPLTATLAALGVGFLLGVVLFGRDK